VLFSHAVACSFRNTGTAGWLTTCCLLTDADAQTGDSGFARLRARYALRLTTRLHIGRRRGRGGMTLRR